MASALAIVQKRFPSVTTVTDAKEPLFLQVSRHDSKTADPKDHQQCALAKACKRECKPDGVLVSLNTAYVIKGSVAMRYLIPPYAAREIVSFDRKAGFAPGLYEFKPPSPTQILGARAARPGAEGGANKQRNGGLAKRFRHKTSGVREALK